MKLKISIISLICLIAVVAGIVAHNARSDALNDEKNAGEQVVSFFRKDYQPLLEEVREEALGSKLILEVKGRKNRKFVHGALVQEVELIRVVKGKINTKDYHRKMYVVGDVWVESRNNAGMGFTNYIKNGDNYILFANKVYEDYENKCSVIDMNRDMIGFNRLNVSENKSYVCKKGKKHTKYKNVRDSEFFCNDEKTLKKILEFKQGIIDTLHDYLEPGSFYE